MHFRDLNEAQILALAITAEEEVACIYRDFAESLHTAREWPEKRTATVTPIGP